ncbi:unnamed protein product [Caenorhabditis angaria]|uniref:Uncharacterized protein n=1 Tax=Caenorhabditis angaria TaxID=860376 RepID=A0A9P1IEJ2_9PELO|nr:unnamed protein product [Caenorhabditis angaria]
MIRRLGDATFYRAESPSQTSMRESEISIDYSQNDEIDRASCNTVIADPWPESPLNQGLVTRGEISETERNLCKKLSLIVDLVADFAGDANKLAESADELLKELRTKIRVYIHFLDVEMVDTEQVLRFNVDRSSICDDRIDWLLHYTKCHKEMRRVLFELSEEVCDDLEACLEQRMRGIPGKKPMPATLRTLAEMQKGMEMAARILGNSPRQRA